MITNHEWDVIAKKAFPQKAVKAPPFLWTRILSAIETREAKLSSVWWLQWQWMSRITVTAGLLATIGTFYLFQHAEMPLEVALEGRTNQHQALQIASTELPTVDDSAVVVLGLDS